MSNVEVDVRYQLREYMQVVSEFRPRSTGNLAGSGAVITTGTPGRSLLWRLAIALIAPPVFFYKARRVGRCKFVVNSDGVTRSGTGHESGYSWNEIMHLHRLSNAYMLELNVGALPLPYRVFSEEQRQAFESLLPSRLRVRADHPMESGK